MAVSTSHGSPVAARKELGGAGMDSPPARAIASRRNQPCPQLDLRLLASRTGREHNSVVLCPLFCAALSRSPGGLTAPNLHDSPAPPSTAVQDPNLSCC